MKQLQPSAWLTDKRSVAKALLDALLARFSYASVLLTDSEAKSYRISRTGISVGESATFGAKGAVVRVFDGGRYAEYATDLVELSEIPTVLSAVTASLTEQTPEGLETSCFAAPAEEPITLSKATEYLVHPRELGSEQILDRLSSVRDKVMALDGRLLDVGVSATYQEYHKLFLSPKRDMTQSVMWMTASAFLLASRGEEIKSYHKSFSGLGGAEVLDSMHEGMEEAVRTTLELLDSTPIEPGLYDCICSPDVTGMIVHEAFGHGVEMDMFVKDRALAASYIGQQVASPLVTMRDGAASAMETATYFFDDEGTLAGDTVVIQNGILKQGICDAQSAMTLGCAPTGNGRRERFDHKAYTRMTNTFFEGGKDTLESMIASIKEGVLLENASSGMEDPKNWGIQCMVNIAREIKDGKLTGRIFSPIVLTGYVPDLLRSISMMSERVELGGGGMCGKGYKEWVKVSDGGPYIKAKIRLG